MLKVKGSEKIEKSEVKSILIRATNWVGDVVMTMPALEAVRENFPQSSITILAKPWVVPLYENHPAVDRVIPFKKGNGYLADLFEVIRIIGLIHRQAFDLAVLFQNAIEAALLTCFGHVRFRVGYNTDARGIFLTHRVIRSDEVLKVHQVEYYLSILRAMGWKAISREPFIYVSPEDVKRAGILLSSNGITPGGFLIGLSPGAIFGEAKRWPVDRFAKIGDWAVEKWGAKVLVMGSKKEEEICDLLSNSMNRDSLNLCGRTTLGEAMGVISQCDFFLSNDSGLMHIAAALGIPTLAVFGSTNPLATGPRGQKTGIVRHEIECAPCLKPVCPKDFKCMLSIEPEEVWKEMEILREGI